MLMVYHEFLIRHLVANMINTFNKFMIMNVCSPHSKTFHNIIRSGRSITKVEKGGLTILCLCCDYYAYVPIIG